MPAQKPQIDRPLPLERIGVEELFRRLRKEVIGQDPALRRVAEIICRNVATRRPDDSRPIAAILMAGPTGCGKTESARALAKALFGRINGQFHDRKMDQSKMSTFSLFGIEPGFVGYTDEMRLHGGGLITSPIIKNPDQLLVILLDELEKGHQEAPEALFAALDQGCARDSSSGHLVSFRNVIFIVTTNEAGDQIGALADSGASWESLAAETPALIHEHGRRHWPLPFLARFNAVLPLAHPKAEDLPRIAEKLTRDSIEASHNFAGASPEFLEWASRSYRRELGVRDLARTIAFCLGPQFAALPKRGGRLWLSVDAGGTLRKEI